MLNVCPHVTLHCCHCEMWPFKEDNFRQCDLALSFITDQSNPVFGTTVIDVVFALVHIVLLISVIQFWDCVLSFTAWQDAGNTDVCIPVGHTLIFHCTADILWFYNVPWHFTTCFANVSLYSYYPFPRVYIYILQYVLHSLCICICLSFLLPSVNEQILYAQLCESGTSESLTWPSQVE